MTRLHLSRNVVRDNLAQVSSGQPVHLMLDTSMPTIHERRRSSLKLAYIRIKPHLKLFPILVRLFL